MSSKAFEKAGDLLKRMRRAMDTANVEYYIDKKLLSVLDSKFGGGSGSPGRKSDDGIKEDIRI